MISQAVSAETPSHDPDRQAAYRRVCEPGDDDQCPNDKKPIFFTRASTRTVRAEFLAAEALVVCGPRTTSSPLTLPPAPERIRIPGGRALSCISWPIWLLCPYET